MCEPLVSVIIPVYNVEDLIDECINSVLLQSYKNLEVLLVDDGSTDSSLDACKKWANRDSRVAVFHKENGGLSDARNYGLERMSGEYVTFVDSDDVLPVDSISYLVALCKQHNADISICELRHFEHCVSKFKPEKIVKLYTSNQAIEEMFYQTSFLVSAGGKLYKSETFSDIRFPVGMLFEDSATIYKVFEQARLIAYSDKEVYGYRHRGNSITTRKFDERDLDIWEICKEITSHFSNSDKGLSDAADAYMMSAAFRILLNAPQPEFDSQIETCSEWIKSHTTSVLNNSRVRLKTKMAIRLLNSFPRLTKIIYRFVPRWS